MPRYAILDIETTGLSPEKEKITEISVFVHDGNEIVDEYHSLVNPEKNIPPNITNLTGITNKMVANAPKFWEIAKDLIKLTEDTIIVAHNASFDYGFIRAEYASLGYQFKRDKLCTVKLSKKYFPGLPSYSLGNICGRFGISNDARHRAKGDAFATVQLFEKILMENGSNDLEEINITGKLRKVIADLPESEGVYYFVNVEGEIIYVGKSKNIRQRVKQHFANAKSGRALRMIDEIADISCEETGNEMLALLLEMHEIKSVRPKYNRAGRRKKNVYAVEYEKNDSGYITFAVNRIKQAKEILVEFSSKMAAKSFLMRMSEEYNLCQKLCGLYDSPGPCFYEQIGQCKGACIDKEPVEEYNERARQAIQHNYFEPKTLVIVDKGRHAQEKSFVMIDKGVYKGYGYFEPEFFEVAEESFRDALISREDNRDIRTILKSFLDSRQYEKLLKF